MSDLELVCRLVWSDIPADQVLPGDFVGGNAVKAAFVSLLRALADDETSLLNGHAVAIPLPPPPASWVAAAFVKTGKHKAVVGKSAAILAISFVQFLEMVEQYCTLLILAPYTPNARPDFVFVYNSRDRSTRTWVWLVEKFCVQAFVFVDQEQKQALSSSTFQLALSLLFSWLGVRTPPDNAWYSSTFESCSASRPDGQCRLEDFTETALQYFQEKQAFGSTTKSIRSVASAPLEGGASGSPEESATVGRAAGGASIGDGFAPGQQPQQALGATTAARSPVTTIPAAAASAGEPNAPFLAALERAVAAASNDNQQESSKSELHHRKDDDTEDLSPLEHEIALERKQVKKATFSSVVQTQSFVCEGSSGLYEFKLDAGTTMPEHPGLSRACARRDDGHAPATSSDSHQTQRRSTAKEFAWSTDGAGYSSGSPTPKLCAATRTQTKSFQGCTSAVTSDIVFSTRNQRVGAVPIASQVMSPVYVGTISVFEHYEFGDKKGEGSFGQVVRVRQKMTGVERACKSLALFSAIQQQLVETEMALMRKLDHPNVLQFYESYYDGGHSIYLIVELCDGGSVADRIKQRASGQEANALHSPSKSCSTLSRSCSGLTTSGRRGRMSEWEVALMAHDTLAALEYCHMRGIVHRDIKPDNLLYIDTSIQSKVKVIDFGLADFLARLDPAPGEGQQQSLQGSEVGTPHYMAPEIYSSRIYDAKVDMFACGVSIVEALTGQHPFFELGKDSLDSIKAKILRNEFVNGHSYWADVPADAQPLARQLLTPDPRRRIEAAEALRNAWVAERRIRERRRSRLASIEASVFQKIWEFASYNVLKQAALRVMVKELDAAQLECLHLHFEAIDRNGDGAVCADELMQSAKRCGFELHPSEANSILAIFDRGIGSAPSATYSDFLAGAMPGVVRLSVEQLEKVFLRFSDAPPGGPPKKTELQAAHITPQSLRASFTSLARTETCQVTPGTNPGETVSQYDIDQVFRQVGRMINGRPIVDFLAFASMFDW